MGSDVLLRPKDRNYKFSIDNNLSRRFCNFLCGPDAYTNCEFEQVQKLQKIDLQQLRSYPVNLEPEIGELEYQVYLAETEGNEIRVEELKKAIEEEKLNWEKNYELINEGWTKIAELEALVSKFITILAENPDIHKQIEYNFNWEDYFHPHRMQRDHNHLDTEIRESIRYTDNILLEDLQSVLNWIEEAKKRNFEFVTFNYA